MNPAMAERIGKKPNAEERLDVVGPEAVRAAGTADVDGVATAAEGAWIGREEEAETCSVDAQLELPAPTREN